METSENGVIMKSINVQLSELEAALTRARGADFVRTVYAKVLKESGRDYLTVLEKLGALASECVNLATAPAGSATAARPGSTAAAPSVTAAGASTSPVPLGAMRVLATHVLGAGCVSDNATREQLDAAFFAAGLKYPGADFKALEQKFGGPAKFSGFSKSLAATRQAKINEFFRRWNQD